MPITAVLLQHGAFGADEVERTARALQAYAVGLWPLSIVRVVVPAFYALRDVRTPVLAAVAALVANVVASLALIGSVPPTVVVAGGRDRAAAARRCAVADLGHAGLALAASLAAAVNLVWLIAPLGASPRRFRPAADPLARAAAQRRSPSIPMTVLVVCSRPAGGLDGAGPAACQSACGWRRSSPPGWLAFAVTALAVGGPEVASAAPTGEERLGDLRR